MNADPTLDLPLPFGAVARLGSTRFSWGWGIRTVAWSPDGATMAAAGGRHIALFDGRDGHFLRALSGHHAYDRAQPVHAVVFVDDDTLVSFGGDQHARRWNLSSNTSDAIPIHADAGCVSPDGRFVYAQRHDTYRGTVHDLATGAVVREVTGRSNSTGDLSAWSPAGDVLATATLYGDEITLWKPSTGERLGVLAWPDAELYELRFSTDGEALVATANLGASTVWSVRTQTRRFSTEGLQRGGSLYACPALSSRGVLAVAARGRVDLYELATGKHLASWTVGTWGGSVAFSPDGLTLAYAAQGVVRLYDVGTSRELERPCHVGPVSALGVSRDGGRVVTVATEAWLGVPVAEVYTWSLADGACVGRWRPEDGHVSVAPDASVVAACARGVLSLHDPGDGAVRATWSGNGADAPCVLDGATVAFTLQRPTCPALYDVASRTVTQVAGPRTTLLARSPDGQRVVVSDPTKRPPVRVVEVRRAEREVALAKAVSSVNFAAWTEPSRIVTVASDGVVRVCDPDTGAIVGKSLRVLPAKTGAMVRTAAASPDGRWLAVGDGEGVVHLIALGRLAVVASFTGHVGPVCSACFTRDGARLLTGGADATVLVWTLPEETPPGKGARAPRRKTSRK